MKGTILGSFLDAQLSSMEIREAQCSNAPSPLDFEPNMLATKAFFDRDSGGRDLFQTQEPPFHQYARSASLCGFHGSWLCRVLCSHVQQCVGLGRAKLWQERSKKKSSDLDDDVFDLVYLGCASSDAFDRRCPMRSLHRVRGLLTRLTWAWTA